MNPYPSDLPVLEVLRLDHNRLEALPEPTSVHWPKLRELYIGHNAFACIRFHTLPKVCRPPVPLSSTVSPRSVAHLRDCTICTTF